MPLTIQVTFSHDFPAAAEKAFKRACQTWAGQLNSTQPVRIEARWNIPLPHLVAMCIPNGVENFRSAPQPDTWYTSALADKLSAHDCQPGTPDMLICFNSVDHVFNTDPADCPMDEHDLETNALHEMGHGFGIVGLFWVIAANGKGSYGSQDVIGALPQDLKLPFPRPQLNDHPSAFGRLVADHNGNLLTDVTHYQNGTPALGAALTSDALFIPQNPHFATRRKIYAPPFFRPFSTGDHFADNSLMVPHIRSGTRIHAVDDATLAAMALMGW